MSTSKLIQKIVAAQGTTDLVEFLAQRLSASELNSLLLEVFHQRSQQLKPADLLQAYRSNRFVQTATIDPLAFRAFESKLMRYVEEAEFICKECAPIAPFGSCAVVAPVDQKNIITANRHTEVVADVTNVLALEITKLRSGWSKQMRQARQLDFYSVHRHVRAQLFELTGFTPHFKILAMVSGGRDQGSHQFEIDNFQKHLNTYVNMLVNGVGIPLRDLAVHFTVFTNVAHNSPAGQLCERIMEGVVVKEVNIATMEQEGFTYYQKLRFKLVWNKAGQVLDIGDGGLVDWSQQLLQDKKERMLISGLGTEYLFRLLAR